MLRRTLLLTVLGAVLYTSTAFALPPEPQVFRKACRNMVDVAMKENDVDPSAIDAATRKELEDECVKSLSEIEDRAGAEKAAACIVSAKSSDDINKCIDEAEKAEEKPVEKPKENDKLKGDDWEKQPSSVLFDKACRHMTNTLAKEMGADPSLITEADLEECRQIFRNEPDEKLARELAICILRGKTMDAITKCLE